MPKSAGSGGMAGAPLNMYGSSGPCVCDRPIVVPWEKPLSGYRCCKCGRDIESGGRRR